VFEIKKEKTSSFFKCNNVTMDIPTTCTLSSSVSERLPLDAGYFCPQNETVVAT